MTLRPAGWFSVRPAGKNENERSYFVPSWNTMRWGRNNTSSPRCGGGASSGFQHRTHHWVQNGGQQHCRLGSFICEDRHFILLLTSFKITQFLSFWFFWQVKADTDFNTLAQLYISLSWVSYILLVVTIITR